MNAFKLFATAAIFSISGQAFGDLKPVSSGPAIPLCSFQTGPIKYWNVTLNTNDSTERNDLIKALQVFGTGGFSSSFLTLENQEFYVDLQFDTSYYADIEQSQKALHKGLESLVSLEGVWIECSPINIPLPAMTIRN